MASWLVNLDAQSGSYTCDVELLDTVGPLNDWKSRKKEAFSIDRDKFTNQTNRVEARGCGAVACWMLEGFDIDQVKAGDTGNGVNSDAGGDFPVGDLKWTVVSKL
jgi:hypothetical protein